MKLATLCYVFDGERVLMINRNKRENDIHLGKWNGLGGKFNPGETPEECVIREVFEESGLLIKEPVLKGFLTFPAFDDEEDWYVFVFTAHEFSGKIKESDEGELSWIEWEKIFSLPLWEGDKYFLEWLKQDRFFSAKFIYKNSKYITHSVIFY
ncbi:MAG: 8-oxo-dGTP diphosphatase [Ignavibacteria bacterium]|nr:8-oxo-dGTP diphosphatase [Ignavibacteria bacterium]